MISYDSYVIGPPGEQVKVILLDTRYVAISTNAIQSNPLQSNPNQYPFSPFYSS